MIMRVRGALRALVAATAFVALMTLPVRAQTTSAGPAAGPGAGAPRTGWTPGRTPWGDPDVQGIFTNNDESGIPFERPSQFEGKQLQDVTDAELAAANQARRDQAAERAPFLGGLPLGSNPVHWFENTEARNSRAWLIVDPKDGRIPPLTPEAAKRPIPRGGSSFGNGPFNGPEDACHEGNYSLSNLLGRARTAESDTSKR